MKKSETSASETGKVNTGVTTVEYVYRKVVTSYVDEEGKEINPSDKGTKDKKDIPEYTFKETKKDKDGNTIHVYTKKSSSTPYHQHLQLQVMKKVNQRFGKILKVMF